MKYFSTKIKSLNDKKRIKHSLESLLNNSGIRIFIFPFCLFNKSYYSSLKEKRIKPYKGYVTERGFEFTKTILFGNITSGATTSHQLLIKGMIAEKIGFTDVEIEFHLSTFSTLFKGFLIFSLIVSFLITKNYLFIIVPIVLILDVINYTVRNYLKIKRRLIRK